MKVLITGGYGFIGSHVAQQFYKEGYEIFIIDNLCSGDKRNVEFKHKSFLLSVEDRKCEEVFRNNRFDVVVHLAAQVNIAVSVENPLLDTQTNVLGLTNMLSLSHKYNVQKFIGASSAAVYGKQEELPIQETSACCPISPYGINNWIGETYCEQWRTVYGLDTLCLRISNVYGPRRHGNLEDGGVISVYIDCLTYGKDLPVFGDGAQTRDFIYIEDVAQAIYRAACSNATGVYNLSTGFETSMNQLCEIFRSLHERVSISYKADRLDDLDRSVLDNKKLMAELDWAPRYHIEEGLQKTYEWAQRERPMQRKKTNKVNDTQIVPSRLGKVLKALLPYTENALVFALAVWLTYMLDGKSYNLIDINLFYIIIVGIVHGNRQSMVAVASSTVLFVYIQLLNGRELLSLLYDTDLFFRIAVYLFIGLIVGYSVERRTRIIMSKEQLLESLHEKYTFLDEVYKETRIVKEELQQQILNNGDSFGKIYAITKDLESLEPEKIFTATVSVVESIMKSRSVTIYTVNKYGSYLRLAARSGAGDFEAPKSMKVEDFLYVQQILKEKRLFINKELLNDAPIMAAPVLNQGEVVAIISLHNMNFENFTLYYQNFFKIIVDLISSALSRAFTYVEATGNQRYLEGTSILNFEVFAEIVASKQIARAKHGVEYVLLSAGDASLVPDDLSPRIARLLRETDYIGLGQDGQLMVLLANSSLEDSAFVMDRFQASGISLQRVERELRYV